MFSFLFSEIFVSSLFLLVVFRFQRVLNISILQSQKQILKKKITMDDGVCIFLGAAAWGLHLFLGIYHFA